MVGAGVFVMPSRFEPWGVVLHEFCTAGFPVICSDKVGAAEAFCKQNENGYIYPSENVNELKKCIKKISSLSDNELLAMGKKSRVLSMTITPELWAESLMKMME